MYLTLLIIPAFATFLLIILLLSVFLNRRKNKKMRLRELEITDVRISDMRHPTGILLLRTAYYRARYWDGGERTAEFKSTVEDSSTQYKAGDRISAYVSQDGKRVVLGELPTVGIAPFLIFVLPLYILSALLILPVFFPAFGELMLLLSPMLPNALVGIVFCCVGIVLLRRERRFKQRLANGCYREISATVTDLRMRRSKKGHIIYSPVFSYTLGGEVRTLRSTSGQRPAKYQIGERATLYQDIKTLAVIESPANSRLIAWVFLGFGVLFLSTAVSISTMTFL